MHETTLLARAGVRPTTHNAQRTTHNADPCIKKITLLVAANLAYQWQVPELAVAVGLSNRQLQRRFKAEMGCCPLHYLRHLRLEKARELLCTTAESVRAIASRVGLNDFSHFVRAFRAEYGVSPAAVSPGQRRATCRKSPPCQES